MEGFLAYVTSDTQTTKIALGSLFAAVIAILFVLKAISGDR